VNRPVIGIIPGFVIDKSQTAVHRDYADAVEAAGGIPCIIPTITRKICLTAIINRTDGIIITGSNSDVHPHNYNQNIITDLVVLNSVREELDFLILDIAFKKKKPLLGICYGHQEINVYLGGTLFQDISLQIPHALKHSQAPPHHLPSHAIRITENSFLHKLTGQEEIKVNSRHHQAVDILAPKLKPVASSPDGINEAYILDSNKHLVIGIQWHPENMWKTDMHALNLFIFFIKQCAHSSRKKK
jgi:putative glutamine amidotransferase